jgi:hypothetical protein
MGTLTDVIKYTSSLNHICGRVNDHYSIETNTNNVNKT